MSDILNVITQVLAYSPHEGVSENPNQRAFDWSRRLYSLPICNPTGDTKTLAPGASFSIFDTTRNNPLDGTSILSLGLVETDPVYRLTVTAGASGFRTPRSITGTTSVTVTTNNAALAAFTFTGATIIGVIPGDVLRIKGIALYDVGPYAFSPLNSGLWTVVSVSGTTLQCVRPIGESFSGIAEVVAAPGTDFQVYSSDGIQPGDRMDVSGTFSSVDWRSYVVSDATPTTIDFISAIPLPAESGLTYIPGTISFYSNAKKFIYLEVDQEASVQFNADVSDNNKVEPIAAGDQKLVGYLHKWGLTYRCQVINKSVYPLHLRFFTGE